MDNLHLFELINALPGLDPVRLALAWTLAVAAIYLLAGVLAVAWIRGDAATRRELLQMLMVVLVAQLIAQAVAHVWPQPQPFALHLGTQYLKHDGGSGLPSGHVTVFWSLAMAALSTRAFATWAFPLLAGGLVVGLSRVYLGAQFPFDVLAALPVAAAAAVLGLALRKPLRRIAARMLDIYEIAVKLARAKLR